MRITLAAEGSRGDVHPLLALGERFLRLGHDVLVCAPPNFRADSEARDPAGGVMASVIDMAHFAQSLFPLLDNAAIQKTPQHKKAILLVGVMLNVAREPIEMKNV